MISMNDFKAEPEEMRIEVLAAAERVVRSGWYVLGEEGKAFEREWAEACGLRHGVGVGNGMDALEIGLRSLGIGKGDEVITTPMTAFATVLAILRAGATPVLADVDPESALLSEESVRRCIGPATRAVLVVHLYGQVRSMGAWGALCANAGIELVEDCAQAHLAGAGGKVAGSFGRLGAYSFYPTKNLGALGDGGMIVTDDPAVARKASCLRNYGQSERYLHPEIGLNSRLDELQAAILRARARWLPASNERRRQIAQAYRASIRNPRVEMLAAPQEAAAHVYHLFVVRCAERDSLQAHLQSRGVQSLIHYPVPAHQQDPCRALRRDPRGLPESERHAATCLSLPCHPWLRNEDVKEVVAAVNDFRGSR